MKQEIDSSVIANALELGTVHEYGVDFTSVLDEYNENRRRSVSDRRILWTGTYQDQYATLMGPLLAILLERGLNTSSGNTLLTGSFVAMTTAVPSTAGDPVVGGDDTALIVGLSVGLGGAALTVVIVMVTAHCKRNRMYASFTEYM